ncbi:hypothetical protein QR680_010237 [Steinernema hermaphroditum]|uniref:Uncharacterized protein n=1 Tax=Steinernema hermaphroditum TaxID=289476 RepID=A0AA39INA2_9BILA|nr:hypothetical protein QR680_010237 [Steinernema hermaphroditum]
MVSESTILGVVYICIITLTAPVHLLIISILIRKQEFRSLTAYRIMVHMSICECSLMVGHFLGGVMSILHVTFRGHLDKIGGCFVNASWIGIVFFTFLLSLNRLMTFLEIKISARLERRVFNALLLSVWLMFCAVFAIHLFPEFAIWYDLTKNGYRFGKGSVAKVNEDIEHNVIFSLLIAEFLLCLATVATIVLRRNAYSTRFKLSSGELKLFVQSIIIFTYLSVIRCAWHFGQFVQLSDACIVARDLATQAVGLLNPLLYLTFNRSIRKHVLATFRFHDRIFVNVVVATSK